MASLGRPTLSPPRHAALAHQVLKCLARCIANSSEKTLDFAITSASSAQVTFENRHFRLHRCAGAFVAREKTKLTRKCCAPNAGKTRVFALAFRRHFVNAYSSRASDFRKSQFPPTQLRAGICRARKIKVEDQMRRAKPRKNQGFRAHIAPQIRHVNLQIFRTHSFRSCFPERNDFASCALRVQVWARSGCIRGESLSGTDESRQPAGARPQACRLVANCQPLVALFSIVKEHPPRHGFTCGELRVPGAIILYR